MRVSQLGYGSMGLRGPKTWGKRVVSDEHAEMFLNRVLDAGINFIDTAPDYGVAEERIGRYIGMRRSEYYLATKCGCDYVQHADHLEVRHTWSADVIRRNLENSLKRLRTDYIDLLQFHGGDAETLQNQGLIDLLQRLKAQGLIRYIGMSNKLPQLAELLELDVFDTFQIPFSCLAPEHADSMVCADRLGAGVIVRGGIAHGGPEAEIQRPALNNVWEAARLNELVPDDCSKAQFILRYTMAHPACTTVIVGTCNESHLEENLTAMQMGPLPFAVQDEVTARVASVLELA